MKKSIKKFALISFMIFCISSNIYAIEDTNKIEKETEQNNSHSTNITASVPAAVSTYSVDIPADIYIGDISSMSDMNYKYKVGFTVDKESGTVVVSSDEKTELILNTASEKTDKNTIPCYNTFETQEFTKNSIAEGNILIKKEDIAKVPQGKYVGSLNFYIKYEDNMKPDPNPQPTPSPSPSPTPTPTPKPTITPIPSPSPSSSPNTNMIEGNYISDVSMRNISNFSVESMSNKLFYKKADISYQNGMATLTLYVIDPIPNYANEGTPLSNVSFTYNGATYSASVNSSSKVVKSFNAAQGFIEESGNYYASPITVTLPVKALEESVNGKLICSAHINAVMNVTQSFYVVLSNFEKGQTPQENNITNINSTKPKSNSQKFKNNSIKNNKNNKDNLPLKTPSIDKNKNNTAIDVNSNNKPSEIMGYVLKTNSLWKMAGFILFTAVVCAGGVGYVWFKNGKFKKW